MTILGKQLTDRYEVGDIVGRGGMGIVYRAKDRLTGQDVALKLLDMFPINSDNDDTQSLRKMLAYEFRVMATLRHPNIISVLNYGFHHDDHPFFAMELLDSPKTILEAGRSVTEARKIDYIIALLQALSYLHRCGIVHGDIKPANVLVTQSGVLKVLDFGLANTTMHTSTDNAISVGGTLPYMPVELFEGADNSPQTDLYAVGVVAYELFAEKRPFASQNITELIGMILATEVDMSIVDAPLPIRSVISKLLDRDLNQRYDNAQDVIRDLQAYAETQHSALTRQTLRESYLKAAPFIGRKREVKFVTDMMAQKRQSAGGMVLIGGESGVGKSRLLDEIRIKALIMGMPALRITFTNENGLMFTAWRDVIRELLLGISTVSRSSVMILKSLIPDIDDLLNTSVPEPTMDISALQLQDTLVSVFQAIQTPLLLILDDMQWAQDNHTLVQELAKLSSKAPLFIVGSYRSDEAPHLPTTLPTAHSMFLERLSANETQILCRAMIGERNLSNDLITYLYHQTEGNALFLVETLRDLSDESGDLTTIQTLELDKQKLAGGVLKIIQRRLESLPSAHIELLQFAAVLGRNIDLNLMTINNDQDVVDQWLFDCFTVAIFDVQASDWQFSHDKIRDALLIDLSENELATIHRQAAYALEHMYADDPSYLGNLINHWHLANEPKLEAYYVHQMASYSMRRSLFTQATNYAKRALDLIDVANAKNSVILLYLILGQAYQQLGDLSQASNFYAKVADLAEDIDDKAGQAKAMQGLGQLSILQSDFEAATLYLGRSNRLFQMINDTHGIINVLNDVGDVYRTIGNIQEALEYQSQALGIALGDNDLSLVAKSLLPYAQLLSVGGDYEQAIKQLTQCKTIYTQLDDTNGQADIDLQLAMISIIQGEFTQAQNAIHSAETIYQDLQNKLGIGKACCQAGELATLNAQFSQATTYFDRSLLMFNNLGNRAGFAYTMCMIGYLNFHVGKTQDTMDYLIEGLTLLKTLNRLDQQLVPLCHLVEVLLAGNYLEEGEAYLSYYLNLSQQIGDPLHISCALIYQSEYLRIKQQVDATIPYLRDAYNIGHSIQARLPYHRALLEIGHVMLLRKEYDAVKAALSILMEQFQYMPKLSHQLVRELQDKITVHQDFIPMPLDEAKKIIESSLLDN